MSQNTRDMAVNRVNEHKKTGVVHVPADVQRDQGICIDDDVQVTFHDLGGFIDQASFIGPQTAGDRVTVPVDFVREVGLELNTEHTVSYEKVEADDGSVSASSDDSAESEADESDDPGGLSELFG